MSGTICALKNGLYWCAEHHAVTDGTNYLHIARDFPTIVSRIFESFRVWGIVTHHSWLSIINRVLVVIPLPRSVDRTLKDTTHEFFIRGGSGEKATAHLKNLQRLLCVGDNDTCYFDDTPDELSAFKGICCRVDGTAGVTLSDFMATLQVSSVSGLVKTAHVCFITDDDPPHVLLQHRHMSHRTRTLPKRRPVVYGEIGGGASRRYSGYEDQFQTAQREALEEARINLSHVSRGD